MSSERERILLGYPPHPNPNHSSNSNVDFTDVFGGPPRRSSSITDLRRSRADSLDSGSPWRGSGSGYGSGSGLGDRPVFGEMSSPATTRRNRHLKDDFYSDIFMSGDSGSSSPKKIDVSNPGSLVLSPNRSFENPARGGEMLPEKLSLPSSPTAFVPGLTARAVNTQDDLKTDSYVLYRQSPLSRQVSDNFGKSSEVTNSTSKSKSTSLENYVRNGQFHFSIYKWAGKGVTLIMPSKSNSQTDSWLKRLPEIILQDVDVTIHEDDMSSLSNARESHNESLDKLTKNTVVDAKVDVDSINMERNIPIKFHTAKTDISAIYKDNNGEVSVTSHAAQKAELKNLQQLFDDDLDKKQSKEIPRPVGPKEQFITGDQSVPTKLHINQQAGKESTPTTSPEEKVTGSKLKGKVKDFIKIFNQEGSPKRKGTFENPGRRARGKDEGKGNIEDQVFSTESKSDEQLKTTSSNILFDEPVPIYQNLGMAEEVNFNVSFDVDMIDDFEEMKDPLRPCSVPSDSTPDILYAFGYNVEESHIEDIEGHLVDPLFQDQNKDQKSDQEEIKSIDAKIRQWSKGKEGNIRSLLSTLQFVLWPESGWKPVPLVDIIEGPAVKRAYQKALLRLHPDKLQQKGAAEHQKYIAEKVFDIMQEAWDQFNSISQI